MAFEAIQYSADGPVARIVLDRPGYRNAQSWQLLDELDEALDLAMDDDSVRVVVVSGAGGNFSAGHDLGTPEQAADRERRAIPDLGLEYYDNFRHYNLELTLKWRNLPKPTIAMVEGYCIFGGWMIAAAMDIVFASPDSLFLAGLLQYYSVPFDVGIRKAKELCFESRFITAEEAHELGFVNRVIPADELEVETINYARRVAENNPMALRMSKLAANLAQDMQGFSGAIEAAFHQYMVMAAHRGGWRVEGARRLGGVDLAMRGLRGERAGLLIDEEEGNDDNSDQ